MRIESDARKSGRAASRSRGVLACAALALLAAPTAEAPGECESPPAGVKVESVATAAIHIRYHVRPGPDPLRQVDLWYSRDCGATWELAPSDGALKNPLRFEAPAPGLYAFYLVLHNARASTPPPAEGSPAHRWVRMLDGHPPDVQILSARADARFDLNREIHLRWRVVDDNCGDRPVSLHYRTARTRMFKPIADSLPARGSYRWTVPEGLSGRIEIKASAVDRRGRTGQDIADGLRIEQGRVLGGGAGPHGERARRAEEQAPAGSRRKSQAAVPDAPPGIHGEPDAGRTILTSGQAKEAKRLYDLATWHRLRGESGVAVARYRDALAVYPDFTAARNDLAALLLLQGDVRQAEQEYARILERDPRHRSALKGLGLVQARKRKYRSAHETLQKLLLLDPTDAEAWLHFGDVCMFMGDRRAAREAWTKASLLDAAPAVIRRRAEKRLAIYPHDRLVIGGAESP